VESYAANSEFLRRVKEELAVSCDAEDSLVVNERVVFNPEALHVATVRVTRYRCGGS